MFRDLVRTRSRFVFAAAAALFAFNMAQPVSSVFTRWLDRPAVGPLTWGWVYAFAQFVVPLALLYLYVGRARRYDAAAAALPPQTRTDP